MKHLLIISMSSLLLLSPILTQAADTDPATATTSPGMTSPDSSSSGMTSLNTSSSSMPATPTTSTLEGVPLSELTTMVNGWSAKKDILGKNVVNDQNEKVGVIDDVIITPDKMMSYAVIGAGGFLGMGKHDVAIKTEYLHTMDDKLILNGATKDLLKQLPEFKYPEKGK